MNHKLIQLFLIAIVLASAWTIFWSVKAVFTPSLESIIQENRAREGFEERLSLSEEALKGELLFRDIRI